MQPAEPKSITVRGLNVRYVREGQGPAVLLVHGLGSSLATWHRNIVPLAEAGFTVLALDLPGQGDSDRPPDLNYDPVSGARLLNDFINELGVDRVSLVGNSAGGLISSLMTLEYPDKVEHLVLVASGGLGKHVSWLMRLISLPVVGELLYRPWLHYQVGLTRRVFHRPPPLLEDLLAEQRRVRGLPGSSRASLRSIRSSIDHLGRKHQRYVIERLKDSPVPLLTIWGRDDVVVPWSQAETIRKELPRSLVHVIPQCGHWPQMEKADEFNRLVSEFLKTFPVDGLGDPTG